MGKIHVTKYFPDSGVLDVVVPGNVFLPGIDDTVFVIKKWRKGTTAEVAVFINTGG
jgi:hypothetical protein